MGRFFHCETLGDFVSLHFRLEAQNGPRSFVWPLIQKMKTHPFLKFWKLKKIKCLFFWIWGYIMENGNFVFSWDFVLKHFRLKSPICHRFIIWPRIQKKRTLYFLQLSKFKKIICLIFWKRGHMRDLWPFCNLALRHLKTKFWQISKYP